jgi:hypothetical protein
MEKLPNPREQFLIAYFTDCQTDMRWRREVEYKLLTLLVPLAPLQVAGLFALSTVVDAWLTLAGAVSLSILTLIVFLSVRAKIIAENKIYVMLGEVVVRIWDTFGLFDPDGSKRKILDEASRKYGTGPGYKLTLKIVAVLTTATIVLLFGIAANSFYGAQMKSTQVALHDRALSLAATAVSASDSKRQGYSLYSLERRSEGRELIAVFALSDNSPRYRVIVDLVGPTIQSVELAGSAEKVKPEVAKKKSR